MQGLLWDTEDQADCGALPTGASATDPAPIGGSGQFWSAGAVRWIECGEENGADFISSNGTGSRTNLAQTAVCSRTSISASNSTWKNWLNAVIAKLKMAIMTTSIATVTSSE